MTPTGNHSQNGMIGICQQRVVMSVATSRKIIPPYQSENGTIVNPSTLSPVRVPLLIRDFLLLSLVQPFFPQKLAGKGDGRFQLQAG